MLISIQFVNKLSADIPCLMRDVYAHMLDKGFTGCWRSDLTHSNHTLSGYGQNTSSVQNLTVNN